MSPPGQSGPAYERRPYRSGPVGPLRIGGAAAAGGPGSPLERLLGRLGAAPATGLPVAARVAIAGVVIATTLWGAHRLGLNPAAGALVLQLLVLLVAAAFGLVAGVTAAVGATVGLPLLLPPTGSWRVDDPKNWVALGSFLLVSGVGSQLVARARARAAEAQARQEELAGLYRLSVDLLTAVDRPEAAPRGLAVALAALEAPAGGLVEAPAGGEPRALAWFGPQRPDALNAAAEALRRNGPVEVPAARGRDLYLPQEEHGQPRRVFVACATPASRRAAESVAALLWLTLEHQRILAEAAHLDALREGDRLKTSLLRAISHDLASPLTAVGLEVDGLRRAVGEDAAVRRRVDALAQDLSALRRRIENLLAMARIEAGRVQPRPEPVPPADLFRAVREHLGIVAAGRPLAVTVAAECPDLWVDPSLALEILVNLVDNAHRASPEGEVISLVAGAAEGDRVAVEVRDRGAGVPAGAAIEPMLGDGEGSGLGLEIARAFARASGGQLSLVGGAGGVGTVARLLLPADARPETALP